MKISKIFGFYVPVRKVPSTEKISGSEILPTSKLFAKLSSLFSTSEKDCDIEINFIAQTGKQDNEVRDFIVKLCSKFTIKNCDPLVEALHSLTNKKIKDGLLFFIYAKDKADKKLLIARFPSEEGITVKYKDGEYVFEILDDVFLKNSKYKAVYYQASINDFWSGFAVDKQISDIYLKEISDYWIRDFLQSELKLNSARGSKQLAQAVRKTIIETTDDIVKEELVGLAPFVKNINAKILSFKTFFEKMNISEKTMNEVLSKFDNQESCKVSFQFDSEVFTMNCNYIIHILDNGAGIMGPSTDFSILWQEELAEDGKSKFSTKGKKIKTKVSNKI